MNEYDTFHRLHNQMHGLFSKNIDLEKECIKMEDEIKAYEKEIALIVRILLDNLIDIIRGKEGQR